MIPKALNEIEWSDIEALRDSGREEDDTIEFKGSFSGGSDYLAFNDAKRAKAIEAIAREAVAFLNGRGGDIIIGAKEAANDHPKIEEITPVQNIDQTVQRLEQSLAALIEPTQTVLGLRAVKQAAGDSNGVVVVRCPASLRAPHRFTPTKECYVRRGRSSVPMPMDEVQDMATQRTRFRTERAVELESMFDGLEAGAVRRERAIGDRFHIRIGYLPFSATQILLSDVYLRGITTSSPAVYDQKKSVTIDDDFLNSNYLWKPVLRGLAQTHIRDQGVFFELTGRQISESGEIVCDVAWREDKTLQGDTTVYSTVRAFWIIEFMASILWMVREMTAITPILSPGILSVRTFVQGKMKLIPDQRERELIPLCEGLTKIKPFEIFSREDIDEAFVQLQKDLFALVERTPPYILSFSPSQ